MTVIDSAVLISRLPKGRRSRVRCWRSICPFLRVSYAAGVLDGGAVLGRGPARRLDDCSCPVASCPLSRSTRPSAALSPVLLGYRFTDRCGSAPRVLPMIADAVLVGFVLRGWPGGPLKPRRSRCGRAARSQAVRCCGSPLCFCARSVRGPSCCSHACAGRIQCIGLSVSAGRHSCAVGRPQDRRVGCLVVSVGGRRRLPTALISVCVDRCHALVTIGARKRCSAHHTCRASPPRSLPVPDGALPLRCMRPDSQLILIPMSVSTSRIRQFRASPALESVAVWRTPFGIPMPWRSAVGSRLTRLILVGGIPLWRTR